MATNNGHATVLTKKILFVTNAESGQANTILALALEASARPNVEVHIASFPVLERRVDRLSPKLNFHPLDGKDMIEMYMSQGLSERDAPHLPTTKSFAGYGKVMAIAMTGWEGECAFSSFLWCVRSKDAFFRYSIPADIQQH